MNDNREYYLSYYETIDIYLYCAKLLSPEWMYLVKYLHFVQTTCDILTISSLI